MIDQFTIEKIQSAAQIEQVVSDFITLRKRGVNYVGLCPFHDDKTPSFYVSPAKNICKCFSCGEGGTPVHFIMKHEQLSYIDALKYLAKKYGIEVKETELTDEQKQIQSDRESMFILNAYAQKTFTANLFEHSEGKSVGLAYFHERGFRDDTIKKFQLGYSLEQRDAFSRQALKAGYNPIYLEKTGLSVASENQPAIDRFRGRVMFPVHTLSGKIVAFGGRILKNEKTAKYVNSPESDIYHKSRELYGIYFTKQAIAKADKCFLVEGYTDVIAMFQAGVENVVASSGTALTQGQINMIRRITTHITVIYDGDAAGIKAAIRGIDLLLEEGMNVKVVLLPDGEDPDSFARKRNAFEFALYIQQQETDFIRFKTKLLLDEAGEDPIKRATLISDILRSIALIPDNIIRSVYIKECSDLLEIKELTLLNELNKIRLNRKKTPDSAKPPQSTVKHPDLSPEETIPPEYPLSEEELPPEFGEVKTGRKAAVLSPYKVYEEALLRYVIQYGEQILFDYIEESERITVRIAAYIHSELQHDGLTFLTPEYRIIMEETVRLCDEPHFTASRYFLSHPDPAISRIAINLTDDTYYPRFDIQEHPNISSMPEEEKKEWQQKVIKQMEEFERHIRRDLFSLKIAYIKQQISEIRKKMKDLQKRGEMDESIRLIPELTRLNEIKKALSKELGERIILKM
jgi:DNA primase